MHKIFSSSLARGQFSHLSLILALCVGSLSVSGCAEKTNGPERLIAWAESFVADGQLSEQEGLPIVVFVSQKGCEFCEALREQVLFPMVRSGNMQEKWILRELSLDDGFTVQDFDGETISGRQFAERYGSVVTPTLLYLGAGGNELVAKRVGISNIEYYGFYLGQSIDEATSALRAPF